MSDTAISAKIRSTALRHGLLSFLFGTVVIAMTLFGTVVIAMTINLLAGLGW